MIVNSGSPSKFYGDPDILPRRYFEMFDAEARTRLGHVPRADSDGYKQKFDRATAVPVFVDAGLEQFRPELPGYRAKELLALDHFNRLESGDGIDPSASVDTPSESDREATNQEEPNG